MADIAHVTPDDMNKWIIASRALDTAIMAKISVLTCDQKQKLSVLIDKWIGNLKP